MSHPTRLDLELLHFPSFRISSRLIPINDLLYLYIRADTTGPKDKTNISNSSYLFKSKSKENHCNSFTYRQENVPKLNDIVVLGYTSTIYTSSTRVYTANRKLAYRRKESKEQILAGVRDPETRSQARRKGEKENDEETRQRGVFPTLHLVRGTRTRPKGTVSSDGCRTFGVHVT